jgi:O-methyltransferase involved in polyketide biosynthesis
MRPRRGSDAISPTAHYTGHVWARNALSHAELGSREGRLLFGAVEPWMVFSRMLGGPSIEPHLLARHRVIDQVLEVAIDDGAVSQVIEIACGLSPRGWRFARRYGERITYVEADLPAMADRKRGALERMGALSEHHRVVDVDALRDGGPDSVQAIAQTLEADRGLAIITEGLLSYLPRSEVLAMWRRFAGLLEGFADGRYISDLHLASDAPGPQAELFKALLGAFVRGRVDIHFADAAEAEAALLEAGFRRAAVYPTATHPAAAGPDGKLPGTNRVSVIDAASRPR